MSDEAAVPGSATSLVTAPLFCVSPQTSHNKWHFWMVDGLRSRVKPSGIWRNAEPSAGIHGKCSICERMDACKAHQDATWQPGNYRQEVRKVTLWATTSKHEWRSREEPRTTAPINDRAHRGLIEWLKFVSRREKNTVENEQQNVLK